MELVVFASGRGSNFRAICDAVKAKKLPARVNLLVCNVAGAEVCKIAREYGVSVLEVPHEGLKRAEHEAKIFEGLKGVKCDWVVLAGYMRLFSKEFVRKYPRIVNIHPSLLPSFPGMDAYGQALRYGVKVTGATVHLVGDGLDDGPIVAQRALEILAEDTLESLTARGLQLEHELYVETLRELFTREWDVKKGGGSEDRPRVVFGRCA